MKLIIIGTFWSLFIVMLVRSIMTQVIRTAPSRRFLLQLFLTCLAISFWGEASEQLLDSYFWHLPVGGYLKYFALLWVTYLFDDAIREAIPEWESRYRWLKTIVPLGTIVGVFSFIVYALIQPFDKMLLHYLIIGARDAWIMPVVFLMFLPAIYKLWKREAMPAMKLRLGLSFIAVICFLITFISSISAAILAVFSYGLAAEAAFLAQPFVALGALFFIPVFVPQKGLNLLTTMQRAYIHYRLEKLRTSIAPNLQSQTKASSIRSLAELELSIYRNTIDILDYYPSLETINPALYQEISSQVASHPDFEDLVNAMAKL